MTQELNKQMASKLRDLNLPYLELKVFGAINCNIHVTCEGRETAEKVG